MSLFNGTAIGLMLKAVFPVPIEAINQKYDELQADGTIDKLVHVFQEMGRNGTAEQLIAFAGDLSNFSALLGRIETLLREAGQYPVEPGSDPVPTGLIGHDGTGMLERTEPN